MFESVNGRTHTRTDGRTPSRPVYYKLINEPSAQKMNNVTPSKDIRSSTKFCVSVNMMPVDTFKFILRGTTRVQHSKVYR